MSRRILPAKDPFGNLAGIAVEHGEHPGALARCRVGTDLLVKLQKEGGDSFADREDGFHAEGGMAGVYGIQSPDLWIPRAGRGQM